MLFNYLVYLIIPWAFGIILYRKDSKLFLSVFPLSALLAFLFNTTGVYLGYWSFTPANQSYLWALLLNIGLYPILGTYFIYLLHHNKINLPVLVTAFSVVSTLLKGIMLTIGKTVYRNGWNIYYTFIVFLVAYLVGYFFYTVLEKKRILK